MPDVLSDADVGLGQPILTDADVGLLSDADVGLGTGDKTPRPLTFPLDPDVGAAEEAARPVTESLPSVSDPSLEPRTGIAGTLQQLRQSPAAIKIFGPPAAEKEAMQEGGGLGTKAGLTDIAGTMLKFTSVPPPIADEVRGMTGATISTLPIPETARGALEGIREFALTMPIAPLPAASGRAGKAVLGAFTADWLSHLPEQKAAYEAALEAGDTREAAKIATSQVMAAGLTALAGKQMLKPNVEAVAPKTAEALRQQPEVLKPSTTGELSAIQEQVADAGVLRQERSEVGLPQVGEGNAPPEAVAGKVQEAPVRPETRAVAEPTKPKEVTENAQGQEAQKALLAEESLTPVAETASTPAPEPPAPRRVQLKKSPQTYTVLEEMPRQAGDLPTETYYRVKNDKTGEVLTVESKDFKQPKKAKVKAVEPDVPSISVGPGAASPGEFAQRQRKTEQLLLTEGSKIIDLPPDAIRVSNFGDEYIRILMGDKPKPPLNTDYQTFNDFNSGQFAFGFGKLGENAKKAWETMALGEMEMRESIGRDIRRYVTDTLKALPREFRKEGGKAFTEVLDGKKMEAIEEAYAGKPEVVEAAREVKTRLEEIRTTIRDIKRERYRKGLEGMEPALVDDLFARNVSETNIAGLDKQGKVDAMVRAEFPDDWGISDGSYLPHLFQGQFKITAKLPGAEEASFVTRATTPAEAKAKIYELTRNNPEYKDAAFNIEQDTIMPGDAVRLGDRAFWSLINKQKQAITSAGGELSPGEIKNAQAGIIGRKASKEKWFGSTQHREGYRGYEKDYSRLMSAYLSGFHRWRVLSRVNSEVQPLIEKVQGEGRRNAATRLNELMDNLWGKPKQSTLKFDALLQRNELLRETIKPLALERWSRNVRSAAAMATLRTPRFAVVNRLQPLQGLYPLVGERIMAQAKIRQHTAEGRKLLDEAGVIYDPAQWAVENAPTNGIKEFLQRLSGETSNQELAFLAMFQHGTERGLARPEAIKYAKLRGQLFTQFIPLVTDTPRFMEGPITATLFQYKRFPIKQLELTTKLAQDKNVPGLVRMAATFAAIGGLSYYMRQLWSDAADRKEIKDKLTNDYGSKVADGIMYGLPGLLGADLSGSLVLFDEPWGANIYEKIGRQVTGPAVGLGIEASKSFTQQEQRSLTDTQKTMDAIRRIPSLRPLAELHSLITGDLDVRTPDGRVKFEKTVSEALANIGSFRTTSEANQQLAVSAIMELKQETDDLKNQYKVASESGEPEKIDAAIKAIQDFNDRWPEVAITGAELQIKNQKERQKTIGERSAGQKFQPLLER